jgi:hypothetical protein
MELRNTNSAIFPKYSGKNLLVIVIDFLAVLLLFPLIIFIIHLLTAFGLNMYADIDSIVDQKNVSGFMEYFIMQKMMFAFALYHLSPFLFFVASIYIPDYYHSLDKRADGKHLYLINTASFFSLIISIALLVGHIVIFALINFKADDSSYAYGAYLGVAFASIAIITCIIKLFRKL